MRDKLKRRPGCIQVHTSEVVLGMVRKEGGFRAYLGCGALAELLPDMGCCGWRRFVEELEPVCCCGKYRRCEFGPFVAMEEKEGN